MVFAVYILSLLDSAVSKYTSIIVEVQQHS